MEFKIQKTDLVNGLYLTQSVVEKKSTMPILASVLIEAKGKTVSFSATDLEVGVISHHQAEVMKPGKIVIQARGLYDIAKELPEDLVTIKVLSNNWVNILCGKSKFKMVGAGHEDFPTMPAADGPVYNMDAKDFLEMISKVSYAMSNDETRYTLNGVYLEEATNGSVSGIRMVATDGHRLSMSERAVKGKFKLPKGVILPKKGVWELKKLLEDHEGDFSMQIGEKTISANTKAASLVCRLVDGQFPPYKQVIPKDNKKVVIVDRQQFIQSLKRVSLMADDRAKGVKLQISSGNLDLMSSNPDLGEANEETACVYKGEKFDVGFNARYFIDVLGVIQDEKVTMELKNDTTPCIIRSEFDKGFLSVVMPMRI